MRPFSLDAPGSPPCEGPSQPYRKRNPLCGGKERVGQGWPKPDARSSGWQPLLPRPERGPHLLRLLDDDEVGTVHWRTQRREAPGSRREARDNPSACSQQGHAGGMGTPPVPRGCSGPPAPRPGAAVRAAGPEDAVARPWGPVAAQPPVPEQTSPRRWHGAGIPGQPAAGPAGTRPCCCWEPPGGDPRGALTRLHRGLLRLHDVGSEAEVFAVHPVQALGDGREEERGEGVGAGTLGRPRGLPQPPPPTLGAGGGLAQTPIALLGEGGQAQIP